MACSPHLDNIEETVSTLKFAERAKTIKNKVTPLLRCLCLSLTACSPLLLRSALSTVSALSLSPIMPDVVTSVSLIIAR